MCSVKVNKFNKSIKNVHFWKLKTFEVKVQKVDQNFDEIGKFIGSLNLKKN